MESWVRQAFIDQQADLTTGLIPGTDLHGYHNSREREWKWVQPMIGKKYGSVTPLLYDPDHKMIDLVLSFYKPEERVCAERMIRNNTGYSVVAECDCGRIWYPHTYHLRYRKLYHCPYCDTTRYKPPNSKLMMIGTSQEIFNSQLYTMYRNMVDKCYNPKSPNYANYGAKGIRIYEKWYNPENIAERFHYFVSWALDNGYYEQDPEEYTYQSMLIIDRKDPNGNFDPENTIIGERGILHPPIKSKYIPKPYKFRPPKLPTMIKRTYMDPYNWKCVDDPSPSRYMIDDVVYASNTVEELFGMKPAAITSRKKRGWSEKDAWQIPNRNQLLHLEQIGLYDQVNPEEYTGPRYDKYGILRDYNGFAVLIKHRKWFAANTDVYHSIYKIDDIVYTFDELLDTFHMTYSFLMSRLSKNWSIYDAVTIPPRKLLTRCKQYFENALDPATYNSYRYDKYGVLRDSEGFVVLVPKKNTK